MLSPTPVKRRGAFLHVKGTLHLTLYAQTTTAKALQQILFQVYNYRLKERQRMLLQVRNAHTHTHTHIDFVSCENLYFAYIDLTESCDLFLCPYVFCVIKNGITSPGVGIIWCMFFGVWHAQPFA